VHSRSVQFALVVDGLLTAATNLGASLDVVSTVTRSNEEHTVRRSRGWPDWLPHIHTSPNAVQLTRRVDQLLRSFAFDHDVVRVPQALQCLAIRRGFHAAEPLQTEQGERLPILPGQDFEQR